MQERGGTLKERTVQLGQIPSGELLARLRPGMSAMETMHHAGVIHRDIGPDNLMCLSGGGVKLMDFGCAKELQRQLTQTVTLKHGFAPGSSMSAEDRDRGLMYMRYVPPSGTA